MKPTAEQLETLRIAATYLDRLDKYVYLREDEKGRYIEYAFIDGAPENNRCLSWYDKLQPNALERNGYNIEEWEVKPVDELYELMMFSCGRENTPGEGCCKPGHPKRNCAHADNWTFDEPCKCACWVLAEIYPDKKIVSLSVNQVCELIADKKITPHNQKC